MLMNVETETTSIHSQKSYNQNKAYLPNENNLVTKTKTFWKTTRTETKCYN